MIAGINSSGRLTALYPQYNVSKIKATKKIDAADSKDSLQAMEKQEEFKSSIAVSEDLKNAKSVSYSENPYDQSRKVAENTLLVGQNFDIAV